jgi:WhiB family redox-sensing transcriptional regulator
MSTGIGWRRHAACAAQSDVAFFGPENETATDRAKREAKAKAICFGCPVRRPCGEFAITKPEKHGVWGGFGEQERARIRRKYLRELRSQQLRSAA